MLLCFLLSWVHVWCVQAHNIEDVCRDAARCVAVVGCCCLESMSLLSPFAPPSADLSFLQLADAITDLTSVAHACPAVRSESRRVPFRHALRPCPLVSPPRWPRTCTGFATRWPPCLSGPRRPLGCLRRTQWSGERTCGKVCVVLCAVRFSDGKRVCVRVPRVLQAWKCCPSLRHGRSCVRRRSPFSLSH